MKQTLEITCDFLSSPVKCRPRFVSHSDGAAIRFPTLHRQEHRQPEATARNAELALASADLVPSLSQCCARQAVITPRICYHSQLQCRGHQAACLTKKARCFPHKLEARTLRAYGAHTRNAVLHHTPHPEAKTLGKTCAKAKPGKNILIPIKFL